MCLKPPYFCGEGTGQFRVEPVQKKDAWLSSEPCRHRLKIRATPAKTVAGSANGAAASTDLNPYDVATKDARCFGYLANVSSSSSCRPRTASQACSPSVDISLSTCVYRNGITTEIRPGALAVFDHIREPASNPRPVRGRLNQRHAPRIPSMAIAAAAVRRSTWSFSARSQIDSFSVRVRSIMS